MSADVEKAPNRALAVARDDDGDVPDGAREESGRGQPAEMADVLPGRREDPLALERPELGI